MSKFIDFFNDKYHNEYESCFILSAEMIHFLYMYVKNNKETFLEDIPEEMRKIVLNQDYRLGFDDFENPRNNDWVDLFTVFLWHPDLNWELIEKDFKEMLDEHSERHSR